MMRAQITPMITAKIGVRTACTPGPIIERVIPSARSIWASLMPAATHFALAKDALLAGKHVFVGKPLATSVAEVDELGRLAAARGLVVMAGHTFIYNAAVRFVKKLIDAGELGEIRYVYSQRLNLGRIRADIDALWNFAPHDVSIIQYWLGDPEPVSVFRQAP